MEPGELRIDALDLAFLVEVRELALFGEKITGSGLDSLCYEGHGCWIL